MHVYIERNRLGSFRKYLELDLINSLAKSPSYRYKSHCKHFPPFVLMLNVWEGKQKKEKTNNETGWEAMCISIPQPLTFKPATLPLSLHSPVLSFEPPPWHHLSLPLYPQPPLSV